MSDNNKVISKVLNSQYKKIQNYEKAKVQTILGKTIEKYLPWQLGCQIIMVASSKTPLLKDGKGEMMKAYSLRLAGELPESRRYMPLRNKT